MTKATVSGSFNRHLDGIADAVVKLCALGVRVLSPGDLRIVDCDGPFLFVISDKSRDVRTVQDDTFKAIAESDFLLIASPDGYVGRSTSMAIGFAISVGIPVYSTARIHDRTLREYVQVVDGWGWVNNRRV